MTTRPTLEAIYTLIEATRIVQTLNGARELGVFTALADGPLDPDALSARIDIPPDRLPWLMDALVAMELVAEEDGRYATRVPPVYAELFLHLRDIPAGLRGQPRFRANRPKSANTLYPMVVDELSNMTRNHAEAAARHLARPGMQILELASGAAGWSRAFARSTPSIQVAANDLPDVVDRARAAVEADGLTDQYTYLPGDLFSMDLGPRRFDLVLVPMAIHLFDERDAETLVTRAASVLRPGGKLVLIDVFSFEERTQLPVALYSLELICRTEAGRVHDAADATRWMQQAGLQHVEAHNLPLEPRVTLLTAEWGGPGSVFAGGPPATAK